MAPRLVATCAKASKVVIVGAGPAGIHFAKRLKDEGYSKHNITILEAQKRLGGKSFTEFLPEQPSVRHEMGTCYMHLGYGPVRDLLKEYGLGDSEIGLGDKYLQREREGKQRKVWDLQQTGDFTRGDYKGQDFDDWMLSTADRKEVEGYYGDEEPPAAQRLSNILAAAKKSPKTFVKGLRMVRDSAGNAVEPKIFGANSQMGMDMSDEELVGKLERLEAAFPTVLDSKSPATQAKTFLAGSDKREPDFQDDAAMELEGARWITAGLNLVLQIGRYVDEHEKLFGQYTYGLPPQPSPEGFAEINMTFKEWLDSKGLYALMPFFVYSQAAQGYGSLEKVPAIYGLWWNHPDYVAAAVPSSDIVLSVVDVILNGLWGFKLPNWILEPVGNLAQNWLFPILSTFGATQEAQVVLLSGFQKLWENIVEQEELQVQLGCRVTSIDRSGATPVVTYTNAEGEELTISDAEYVVLAVPLQPAMQGVSAYTKPGLPVSEPVMDEVTRGAPLFTPTEEERAVLSTLESYTLKTVLFQADAFPVPGPIYPGEVWAKALEEYAGRVRYLTNSELSTLGTETAPGQTGYVAYQALDEPPNVANDAMLKQMFEEDVAAIGLTNVNIVREKPWYYFPHFPQQAVQSGAPWKLLELQGKKGMFFAGSSCCFESVLDVMAYNELLLQALLQRQAASAGASGDADGSVDELPALVAK